MKKMIALFLGVLCLAACGKRGHLDYPPGTTYPRQYPAPRQPKHERNPVVSPLQEEAPNDGNATILSETEE